jgi:MinD-like ATPase involved in chromosome partitioning or flagellar assembly
MSAPSGSDRVGVLLAAAGATWETEVIDRLEHDGASVSLTKRCVDLADLLASATTGMAGVAVVSPRLDGLDADTVDRLRRLGIRVVLVASPPDLADGDAERMRRLGIEHLVTTAELDTLVATVADAGEGVEEPVVHDGSAPAGPSTQARRIAVWGPAGAPGRTTVGVGVAAELAHRGHDCFLLDVDPYGGAVAQHLGVLDEVSGLLAAARIANSGMLTPDRLAGAARSVGDHLRVLTGLPRPDRWQEVRPAAYDDLLDEAGKLASYVVLDCGFSLERDPVDAFGGAAPQRNLMTLRAVETADDVIVVGAADPVGLTRLARGLVDLRETVPGVHPRVVVNRTRASLGWTDREIQGMVEGFLMPAGVHFVPDDRAAADRALMAGSSLLESGESALRSAIAAVASGLLGEGSVPPRARRIRRRRAGRDR